MEKFFWRDEEQGGYGEGAWQLVSWIADVRGGWRKGVAEAVGRLRRRLVDSFYCYCYSREHDGGSLCHIHIFLNS